MHQCGYYRSREYYKLQDIILNTFYMKKVPCKLRTKICDDKILLESIYNNTFIKLIDLEDNGLNADIVYPLHYLQSLPSIITDPDTIRYEHDIICNVYHFLEFLNNNKIEFKYDNLIIICNVKDLDNAYWNGFYLTFGNGTSGHSAFTSQMIVGHELSHALIQQINDLEYQGQSGSLNESFADIGGVCYEFYMKEKFSSLGWELGSETGLKLRNMKDPHECNQPMKVNDLYYVNPDSYDDNGGVHTNSGIPNHMFYEIQFHIGYKKAFIFFIKVLRRLNRYSQFKDFANELTFINGIHRFMNDILLLDIIDKHIK